MKYICQRGCAGSRSLAACHRYYSTVLVSSGLHGRLHIFFWLTLRTLSRHTLRHMLSSSGYCNKTFNELDQQRSFEIQKCMQVYMHVGENFFIFQASPDPSLSGPVFSRSSGIRSSCLSMPRPASLKSSFSFPPSCFSCPSSFVGSVLALPGFIRLLPWPWLRVFRTGNVRPAGSDWEWGVSGLDPESSPRVARRRDKTAVGVAAVVVNVAVPPPLPTPPPMPPRRFARACLAAGERCEERCELPSTSNSSYISSPMSSEVK